MVTSIIVVTAMQVADKLQVYTAYYMHGPKWHWAVSFYCLYLITVIIIRIIITNIT